MRLFSCFIIVIGVTVVLAAPKEVGRIVGGTVTSIDRWPFATALLYSRNYATYSQACGGTIITTTAILSAMHCFVGDSILSWRARVGSTNANSGGVIHALDNILLHGSYNGTTFDNDVAVLRTANNIAYNQNVQPARIAGQTYSLTDGEVVWAIGWGAIGVSDSLSEQLRQVQIWTVNQATCRSRYTERGLTITDNMLCSGWLDVGGRDQCQGDSGGPLIHNGVVVGVCSWGYQCALPSFPGVNTRVSRFTPWIHAAAAYK